MKVCRVSLADERESHTMDHAEEQAMELEALEAIYGDDFKRIEGEPQPTFEVVLVPEAGAGEDVNHVSLAMRCVYSPTYPEAPPAELSLRAVRRGALTDEGIAECEVILRDAASSDELLGTAMVYMLAEKCIEWLVDHNQPEMDMHAQMMARLQAQEAAAQQQQGGSGAGDDVVDVGDSSDGGRLRDRRKPGARVEAEGTWRKDANEAINTMGEGCTPVTPESFAIFRKEWEAQRAAAKEAAKRAAGKEPAARNRAAADDGLTGRQLFERTGSSLIDTDAGALAEDEEDLMSAPREAIDDATPAAAAEDDDDAGTSGAAGSGASEAQLLAAVGDEALFDEDEDLDDLPEDDE